MRIDEIMDCRTGTVSANDYAAEALRWMNTRNLAWSFVLDRNQVVGIVFAQDLARLSDALLLEQDVREHVGTQLLMISSEAEIQDAERLMRYTGHRFLGIMKNELPVGIIAAESLGSAFVQPALAG